MTRILMALALTFPLTACGGNVEPAAQIIYNEGVGGVRRDASTADASGGNSVAGTGGTGGFSTGGSPAGGSSGAGEATELDAAAPMPDAHPPELKGVVAFDANRDGFSRDLYLARVDEKCERRLTHSAAQEKQPAFSHDGKKIAFASNEGGAFQIHILDLATSEAKKVTSDPAGATYPAWSPDDQSIVYATGDRELDPNGPGDIKMLSLQDMSAKELITGRYFSPVYAGAGLVLAGTGTELKRIIAENGPTYGASYDIVPITGRIPNPQDPSAAPDNIRVAFSDFCGLTDGYLQLYVARIDGTTGDTCESAFRLARHPDGLQSASWGPYGYIAAEIKSGGIVLVAEDGSPDMVTVATGLARNPDYAPAGFELTTCD